MAYLYFGQEIRALPLVKLNQGNCPPGTEYQIKPKNPGSAPGYDLKADFGLEEGIILFLCLFVIICGNNNLFPLQSARHYTTH